MFPRQLNLQIKLLHQRNQKNVVGQEMALKIVTLVKGLWYAVKASIV
uniref:Uncharacterized protein n=1 Tax=Meloidogyne enterolobii TaxID=390850 RepID=A0A6V7VHZ1_MELEN|nr:unnamed protein product [Meloidogyne enterolobii]